MTTRRHTRRLRPRSDTGPPLPGSARRRVRENQLAELIHIRSWRGFAVSAQLPRASLAAGSLPPLVPGDVRDLAPALAMSQYAPIDDLGEYYSDCDPIGDWWCADDGAVHVRGAIMEPYGAQQVYLLDVCGRGFPLNWTDPEPFASSAIEMWGALYLDGRLEPGGLLDPTARTCRAPWRVETVRRIEGVGGTEQEVTTLDRTPDPWDVDESACYVVDLAARSEY